MDPRTWARIEKKEAEIREAERLLAARGLGKREKLNKGGARGDSGSRRNVGGDKRPDETACSRAMTTGGGRRPGDLVGALEEEDRELWMFYATHFAIFMS